MCTNVCLLKGGGGGGRGEAKTCSCSTGKTLGHRGDRESVAQSKSTRCRVLVLALCIKYVAARVCMRARVCRGWGGAGGWGVGGGVE